LVLAVRLQIANRTRGGLASLEPATFNEILADIRLDFGVLSKATSTKEQ